MGLVTNKYPSSTNWGNNYSGNNRKTTQRRNQRNKQRQQQKVNNEQSRQKLKGPWKIYIQNVRGLVTEIIDKTLNILKEYTKADKILMLNITKIRLNKYITTDANIENYKTFRADRKDDIRGGVAIYLNEKIEANQLCELSHGNCEILAI